MEQPGLEPVPIYVAGITGSVFTHYATMLGPELFVNFLFFAVEAFTYLYNAIIPTLLYQNI